MRILRLVSLIISIGLASSTCNWVFEHKFQSNYIGGNIQVPIGTQVCNYYLSDYSVYSFMYSCVSTNTVKKIIWYQSYDCTGNATTEELTTLNSTYYCGGTNSCGNKFGYLVDCTCDISYGDCEYGASFQVVPSVCVANNVTSDRSVQWVVECGSTANAKVTQETYSGSTCNGKSNSTYWVDGCQTLGPTQTSMNILICPSTMTTFSFVGLLVTLVLALSL